MRERAVLYAHDGPLLTTDSVTYFGLHINDGIRKRYLELGDSVTFMMRVRRVDERQVVRLTPISNQSFSVIEVPNFKSPTSYFRNKPLARRIVEKAVQSHDIIIARLPSAIGVLAVQAAQKFNKPLLVEYVACTFDAYWNYDWKGKLIAHFKMYEQQRIMKTVPYTIYVTNQFLQSRYPTKGKYIACSDVELEKQDHQILKDRLSRIDSTNETAVLTLSTVAAIDVPYKGQRDVIEAISILKNKGIKFKYKIIGKGDPESLKAFIHHRGVDDLVELVGPLPHEQIFQYLKDIDIYIQPSKQEGLPRAVIEAMSIGCPVLGSRLAGIPELINESMTFTPGKVSEIVKKLETLKNKSFLLEQAKTNFKEAGKYETNLLKEKRSAFYKEFLKDNGFLKDEA